MDNCALLTIQGRVLLYIGRNPEARLRDVADDLGITERSAFGIVSDLEAGGYLVKEREGRRNRYQIRRAVPVPESTDRDRAVGEVLGLLAVLIGQAA